jgi:hypothetical protein
MINGLYTRAELFVMVPLNLNNALVMASMLRLMLPEERLKQFNSLPPSFKAEVRELCETAGVELPLAVFPGSVWEDIVVVDVNNLCREAESKCVQRLQEYIGSSNMTDETLLEMRHVCEEVLREHSPNLPLELYLTRHPEQSTAIQIAVLPKR